MKTPLSIYNGLYGDDSFPNSSEFIHIEPLEQRSKIYNWEIKQHLHTNLIQLFIIDCGQGKLYSEKNQILIDGPTVLLIPANTLHGFSFETNISGYVFTISETYFESIFKDNLSVFYDLNKLQMTSFKMYLLEFEVINVFKNFIMKEFSENLPEKKSYLYSLFQLLFLNIYRQLIDQSQSYSGAVNKNLKYILAFQKSVKLNFTTHKTIFEYAQDLNITVVHLNRVCQNVLQKSPIQIIHEHLILEAKKYLLNTSYTVSEIAYFLNFADPAYFTRFFKKNIGVSPSDFRKN